MYLIVISKEDPASVNICHELLRNPTWSLKQDLKFEDNDVHTYLNKALMVTINQYHLFYDNLDKQINSSLARNFGADLNLTAVIFASKHRSASGMKTLTVHPIGNYSEAEYGGKPEELVPAAPHIMTMAYRLLHKHALNHDLEHSVTFEATHHGPYLETPSFFIEIGSDEYAWNESKAAVAIAQTILDLLEMELEEHCKDYPIAIGIGGGHYAPRHTDVARKKRVSFGHIIPSYALDNISEQMLMSAFRQTPGAKYVYFHRKSIKKGQYRELKSWYEKHGHDVISSEDLEDISESNE